MNSTQAVVSQYSQLGNAKNPWEVPTQIHDPSLLGRAQETINYLDTLEGSLARMRGDLFGEAESNEIKRNTPTSLEGLLADICTRTACLVGEAATINNRIQR